MTVKQLAVLFGVPKDEIKDLEKIIKLRQNFLILAYPCQEMRMMI